MGRTRPEPDWSALLDVVHALGTVSDLDQYGPRLLAELQGVVPFDIGVYNELNPRAERAQFCLHPSESTPPAWTWETFAKYTPENPAIQYYLRTGDGSVLRLSDFLSQQELHTLGLYRDVLAPLRIEYQLGFALPARRPLQIGVALCRADRDFTDDERDILNLVRPHLIQAYRSVLILSEQRTALASIESALDVDGRGVVLVGDDDRPLNEGPALATMARYFGTTTTADVLPASVTAWLAEERAATRVAQPLVRQLDGQRLFLRFVNGGAAGPDVILLNERSANNDRAALRELGLTERQAEVLWWSTRGLSVVELAQQLGTSERTVRKHLENVYRKLGVSTRAAATALALEVLHWDVTTDGANEG